jgi:hypothetical protein
MKVQFEFSAADMAQVAGRAVDRSPVVRKWRARARWAWAIVTGILAFLVAPGTPGVRVAIALLLALVMFFTTARGKKEARLREVFRERLGGDGPFLCEVEITEAGIVSRQLGAELRHPWSQVDSVSEVEGGVEIVYLPLGSLLVRDRAFADAQARAEFLAQARGRLHANAKG